MFLTLCFFISSEENVEKDTPCTRLDNIFPEAGKHAIKQINSLCVTVTAQSLTEV